MSGLVRVTFTEAHGDFPAGTSLAVDPASAESLVERGLATVAPEKAAPVEVDPDEAPLEIEKAAGHDSPVLPLSKE